MLSMSYGLSPGELVPGLDDVDRIEIFEEIAVVHAERQQEQQREQGMADARARVRQMTGAR